MLEQNILNKTTIKSLINFTTDTLLQYTEMMRELMIGNTIHYKSDIMQEGTEKEEPIKIIAPESIKSDNQNINDSYSAREKFQKGLNQFKASRIILDTISKAYKASSYDQLMQQSEMIKKYEKQLKYDIYGNVINIDEVLQNIKEEIDYDQ